MAVAIASNALITLADLKMLLGDKVTGISDDKLQFTINSISQTIEDYCSRKFKATDYVKRYIGSDETILQLDEYPIVSVTQIDFEQQGADIITLEPLTYEIISEYGQLYRSYTWPRIGLSEMISRRPEHYARYIKVTYRAGYEVIPYDLQSAVSTIISNHIFSEETNSQGLITYKIGDIQMGFGETGKKKIFTPDVLFVLDKYKKVRF